MSQTISTVHAGRAECSCISRFTIVLLGTALIGMGVGRRLGAELADLCGFAGLLSIACWLSLELVARSRRRQWASTLQRSAEFRLSGQKQWQRLWRLCRGPVSLHEYIPQPAMQTVSADSVSAWQSACD